MKHCLLLHPNDSHIVYPLGATVVIRNVHDNKDQFFLQGAPALSHKIKPPERLPRLSSRPPCLPGHTDRVTALAMTKDGTKLASGQITHMGYLAQILIWDISEIGSGQPRLLHTLKLHKVQIQALAFSCNGRCGHRAGAHLGGVPWWQREGSGMRGGRGAFPKVRSRESSPPARRPCGPVAAILLRSVAPMTTTSSSGASRTAWPSAAATQRVSHKWPLLAGCLAGVAASRRGGCLADGDAGYD